jgi:hypothetical protein
LTIRYGFMQEPNMTAALGGIPGAAVPVRHQRHDVLPGDEIGMQVEL